MSVTYFVYVKKTGNPIVACSLRVPSKDKYPPHQRRGESFVCVARCVCVSAEFQKLKAEPMGSIFLDWAQLSVRERERERETARVES